MATNEAPATIDTDTQCRWNSVPAWRLEATFDIMQRIALWVKQQSQKAQEESEEPE